MNGTLRGRAFVALLCLTVSWQLCALLEALGVRYPGPVLGAVIVLGNALPLLAGFASPALFGRAPRGEIALAPLAFWGPLAWGSWAGGYYLVAAHVAASAAPLPSNWTAKWEMSLPILPATVLVYMGVHPLSALPFFGLRTVKALRRHLVAHGAIVATSMAAWLAWPLTLPRAPLPPHHGSLGLWVLTSLRGSDPPVNLLPSTHCSMAVFAALALRTIDRRLGAWALLTAAGIAVATLLTRQHYVVDVVTGCLLGLLAGLWSHGWAHG